MSSEQTADQALAPLPTRRKRRRSIGLLLGSTLLVYVAVAYVAMPEFWIQYALYHPSFDDVPRITRTAADIPGDPLNVALIGTEAELKKIMLAASWHPADPLTFRSCVKIASATVLRRPYDDAPVSNLYLWGRKEDLAFEQPVGSNPRQRHHVRFWRSEELAPDGRPVWIGAATYDRSVGFSHTTGQITHHIAPDIDTERDHLTATLQQTGDLRDTFAVDGFHSILKGRNGGGDPWSTDGNLAVGIISAESDRPE